MANMRSQLRDLFLCGDKTILRLNSNKSTKQMHQFYKFIT